MCWWRKLWRMSSLLADSSIAKPPLVVVVGATGSGKTRLGVELAQAFPAEIISADSMQVYRGLDVATAKPTAEERAAAVHHLLDFVEPPLAFSVVDFRDRALTIIERLMQQGKVPVVVGGTHYYVESVLWHTLVERARRTEPRDADLLCVRDRKRAADAADGAGQACETSERAELARQLARERHGLCALSTAELHAALRDKDPAMADRLHPNDRRKICRALEVWAQSGQRQSELLAAQADSERRLRYPGRTVVLWLRCDQEEQNRRLDARVDAMVLAGLVRELEDYHDRHGRDRLAENSAADYTKGMFQTLGLKEFHPYLALSESARASPEGRERLAVALADMKRATRRFARRQDHMVRSRFLDHPTRELPLIYSLDTTQPARWATDVRDRALLVVDSLVRGAAPPPPLARAPSATAAASVPAHTHRPHRCLACDRVFIGDLWYGLHIKSDKHK